MTPFRRNTLIALFVALVALQGLPYLPIGEKPTQIAWVEETSTSTPATADVRDSKAWRDAAKECGMKSQLLDVTQIRKAYPAFTAKAEAFGLPCVAILYPSGAAAFQKPPTTAAAMADLVRKAGGK